ncbi:hypothetical protein SRRS_45410 [Sporomusa rhizae]|uniref:SymE family type I addiction module toxin n=1 Tax=Sporomusa rhizae TaxID=357999 RepID=UPI00352AA508
MEEQRKIYRLNLVSGIYRDKKLIPYIRLEGKWLSSLGFQHEERVLVEAEPGRVVIWEIEKYNGK